MNILRGFPVLLIFGLMLSCSEKKQVTKPILSDLTLSVYASAEVYPKDYYLVYPNVSGVIDSWFVEVGDSVKKGQLLAQIRNDNSQVNVESAELNSELARSKYEGKASLLKSIETEIIATKQQVSLDSSQYVRHLRLRSKGVGTQVEFEAVQLRYELSKSKLSSLVQRLNQTRIELKNAYLLSQKNLKVAVTQLGDFGVQSFMDGRVFDVKNKKGELVSVQQPIASVGSSTEYVIELWVDEVDISSIRIGQKVFLRLDAYKDTVFQGIIVRMYPDKNLKNQSFKLEAKFDEKPTRLFSGLSGEANIVLSIIPNALVIPQSYLLNDSSVLTENGPVTIETGRKNMHYVSIKSGIDTNTVILLPEE